MKHKKIQRTRAYRVAEDKLIFDSCMDIGQDLICGAEQKGGTYWRRIVKYLQERRKFRACNFQIGRNDHVRPKQNAISFMVHMNM
jgi:hypothetical protein